MPTLPPEIVSVLVMFAPAFATRRSFETAKLLVLGSLLSIGRRTVAAALRTLGLSQERRFVNYHRLLSRARWSSRKCSQVLLRRLIAAFVPADAPVVLGGDETLERRQGAKIAKLGLYRDAARSSRSFFVKASGLRWVCLMLLADVPWASRVWALPFLTCLAPSERYCQKSRTRHKKLPDWMRQMLAQVRRWLPERQIVFVGDGGYAVIDLLAWCICRKITAVTRLRMDAGLYAPAPERKPHTNGRPRVKGIRLPTLAAVAADAATTWQSISVARWYSQAERAVEVCTGTAVWFHCGQTPVPIRWTLIRDPQGKFATQALLCTDQSQAPEQIIAWFVQRWQLESTFQEARAHLGVETQRQWSDNAIDRTTPALLGLFSIVALMADALNKDKSLLVRQAAWYKKQTPTFVDALAAVRQQIWSCQSFAMSQSEHNSAKPSGFTKAGLMQTLAYAA